MRRSDESLCWQHPAFPRHTILLSIQTVYGMRQAKVRLCHTGHRQQPKRCLHADGLRYCTCSRALCEAVGVLLQHPVRQGPLAMELLSMWRPYPQMSSACRPTPAARRRARNSSAPPLIPCPTLKQAWILLTQQAAAEERFLSLLCMHPCHMREGCLISSTLCILRCLRPDTGTCQAL